MCQRYAGRVITGQVKTTPVKGILAEDDLPTVATRATQLSTITMESILRMPDTNPRKQIATAEVRQHTKKTSWRKKANEVWRTIFGSTQPERLHGSCHPGYKLETTSLRWMLQSQVRRRKTKYGRCRDSPSTGAHTTYHLHGWLGDERYSNRRRRHLGHPSNPTNHHSYAIRPAHGARPINLK